MTKKNPAAVELGRLGGKSKSAAKARASRENGKLGGLRKPLTNAADFAALIAKGWDAATEAQREEIRRLQQKLHGGKP